MSVEESSPAPSHRTRFTRAPACSSSWDIQDSTAFPTSPLVRMGEATASSVASSRSVTKWHTLPKDGGKVPTRSV